MKNWKSIVYLVCLIQIGTGTSIIGVISFLPLFLSEIGVNNAGDAAFWAGLITGITPLMAALSAPFWATQIPKRGPKTMMTIVISIVFLCTLASGFATAPWQLFLCRMVQGLSGGFVPNGLSVIATVPPEKKTSWAMGYFQAALISGMMLGPLLGGAVADTFSYRMPFFFFAAMAFCCLIAVQLFMPAIRPQEVKEKHSSYGQILYFMKMPRVRIMTFTQFLCNFGITGIGPILPLYIKEMAGKDADMVATLVGFIIFIAAGVSAFMSLNVGRLTEREEPHRILIFATLFVGFTFVMQYMMNSIFGLGFWRAVTGLGMGLIQPCTNTVISQSVPKETRSYVFGVLSSIFILGNVAGPVASGILARWFGFSSVFWVTAIAFWMAGGFIIWNFRNAK